VIGIALLCHAIVWASIETAHQTPTLFVLLYNVRDAALGLALLYFTFRRTTFVVPTCVIIAALVTLGIVSNAVVQGHLNLWSAPHIAIAVAALATALFRPDHPYTA
jgi:hypothetical protein